MRIAYRRRYEKGAARRMPSIKPAIEQDLTWHARTTVWSREFPKSNVAWQSFAGTRQAINSRTSIGFPAFLGPTAQ